MAVCAPYFWKFGQQEPIGYFTSLAEVSKAPLYLYDLPVVTGTKLTRETVAELARHPNIRGVKASCDFDDTRQLIDAVGKDFRIIVAQPSLVDVMLHHGVCNHLDGMWAIAPQWTVEIGRLAAAGDWDGAADHQRRLSTLRGLFPKYGFSCFTTIMNARGIPGNFVPRRFIPLGDQQVQALLDEPIVKRLLQEDPAARH